MAAENHFFKTWLQQLWL